MTKDTDPDLRFMALNDLEKEMINTSININNNQLITYSEILIKCLDDEFSEVRNQSLKCFESLPFRLGVQILPVIKELIKKKPKKISITSTIYTMALHNILKNLPPINELYKNILEILLPELLTDKRIFKTEIDYIEILNDLATYIGNFMSNDQILNILNYLLDSCFNADTIIAKKSVLACSSLVKNINDDSTFLNYLNNLINFFKFKTKLSIDDKIILLSIFQSLLNGNPNLIHNNLSLIWNYLIEFLNLDDLNKIDDDYEFQQKLNNLRLNSLLTLIKLFNNCKGENVEVLITDTLNICRSFLSYNPYNNNNDNSEDDDNFEEDDDAEDEYSYDEVDDDDYDDNEDGDCSWKLRSESLVLLNTIIKNFPIKLPLIYKYNFNSLIDRLLLEKNKDVLIRLIETLTFIFESSAQDGIYYNLLSYKLMAETTSGRRYSDVSMQMDDDPHSILVNQDSKICDSMLAFVKIFHFIANEKVNLLLKLFSKFIDALNCVDITFIQSSINLLNQLWKTQLFIPDSYLLYNSALSAESIENFDKSSDYLIDYLKYCLSNDSNHRLITNGLKLINKIFNDGNTISNNEIISKLINSFVDLLCNKIINKNLSTEIRLQSLNTIVLLTCKVSMDDNKITKILNIFVEIISTEVLAYNSLNAISKIIESGNVIQSVNSNWVKLILNYVLEYLNLSELNNSSFKVIKNFSKANLLDSIDGENILKSMVQIHSKKMFNSSNCKDIGVILTHLLKIVSFKNDDLIQIISIIVDLCSYDKFDDVLPALMTQLLNQSSSDNLSNLIQQFGNISDLKISKMLAVLTVVSRNDNSIENIIENLNNNTDIYFSLIFLNQVSKSIDLNIGLEPFLMQFSSDKHNIANMAVKVVSTIVSKYPNKYLHEFLDYIRQTIFLESSFKCLSIILDNIELDIEKTGEIFTLIIEIQKNLTVNINENKEYEYASKCIGNLVIKYDLIESLLLIFSECDASMLNLLITIGNTSKYTFINDTFLDNTNLQLLVKYAEITTNNYIFNNNLLFKEIGIYNLNLILSKKPNVAISLISKILPNIIESEIKANKDYIHTQFIGPYKHKIDDGLNYRKQIYDCIYYLFKTLEDNKNLVFLCNIKWAVYFNKFFDTGIKDDQSIASICLLITLKLFERDPTIFIQDIGDVDIFDNFIIRCRKALNKKIADNAVKQDIEKQNNLIKMIIRFLKKTNMLIENNKIVLTANQVANWTSFIHETKSRFPIFNIED